jgi:hypothetical protein
MTSRDPAIANIKQASSSSSSSKQTVVSKWSGYMSMFASSEVQSDTGLTGTITPSGSNSPILVSVSLPYYIFTYYSSGSAWIVGIILHSHGSGEDPIFAVPVGSAAFINRRSMPTTTYSEDIEDSGVFSADFITTISVPTSFYVSATISPQSSSISINLGNVGGFYDNKTVTVADDYAVMTIREVDTWNDIYPT